MLRANCEANEWFDAERSTSHNNINYAFEWVNDGTGDITIKVDHFIFSDTQLAEVPTYGWLLESRSIIPHLYDLAEENIEYLTKNLKCIFTHDVRLAEIPGFKHVKPNAAPWVLDYSPKEKTKLASMISSDKALSEGHFLRLDYVDKFRDSVDLYGRGFNEIDRKEDGLQDYMFSIAIENANYDSYFTEKLTDCFATRTVPIFYGTKGVEKYFEPEGIIYLDDNFSVEDLSPELYESMTDAIEENWLLAGSFGTAEDDMTVRYFKEYII
jgi:hypothetical protein